MHSTMLRRHNAPRTRRGVQMIEFAILFPAFIFALLFTIDCGRIMLAQSILQDSTFQAARAGAQVGDAGPAEGGVSHRAFTQAISAMPGYTSGTATFGVTQGTCGLAGDDAFIVVHSGYELRLLTPGLASMLNLVVDGDWDLAANSAARCEIVR